MSFKKKIMVVLGLGVVVIVMQMVSISILSSQPPPSLPWVAEGVGGAHREGRGVTLQQSLQHENPEDGRQSAISPSLKSGNSHPGPSPSSNLRQDNDSKKPASSPHPSPQRQAEHLADNKPATASEPTEESISIIPLPVPKEAWNCDISDVKDAMSALHRAKSKDCKELIHNVTCLQKAEKLYNTGIKNTCPGKRNPGKGFENIPYELGTGSPARVVFLMSVHGRAVRQVKRLFKAVYHTDHYYYVHVDSRSDYLHRKLYEELSDFPNVYFPTWRMATIWGGASLLQMLLRSLHDLEYVLGDWQWDYFINLSESDYPLRTNEELGKFLRVHRGKNFVKTHGGDLNKFIQKQGLDRTFVECDNHMWRVNTRPLPRDIDMDGGSDWIAIHRNYSRYLVTGNDTLLTGIKRYFRFTLLPAESFFHTVLRNGPFCQTFVRTNLRITNWNRKLGCRCQYKHIVDWCGCSPNDFLVKDLGRLKAPNPHSFFARKFEAIINQEVIEQLDFHLYGPLPPDLPGLTSYWENVYHSEDTLTKSSNSRYTVYQSFLRTTRELLHSEVEVKGGGTECGLPEQATVREVNVYHKSDQFQGLVVTIASGLSDSVDSPVFEVFLTPISHARSFETQKISTKRVLSLEVGSHWDGKESIFRNSGGILGVWDEPVAAVRMSAGHYSELNLVWDDPIGARVSSYTMKLESAWEVTYHKPKLERPIRPGLWSVRLRTKLGEDLRQVDFSVVPLTHENKQPLSSPRSVNAVRGGEAVEGHEEEFARWQRNAVKSGAELEEWVDRLVHQDWTIDSYCREGSGSRVGGAVEGGGALGDSGGCSWMSECVASGWSTFSPDPKSEFGAVQSNGRLR